LRIILLKEDELACSCVFLALWVVFSQLGGQVTLVGQVLVVMVVFLWERRGDSSVEGALLELGRFSFVSGIYVLEEDHFFSINESYSSRCPFI
jgi:hypothetical protein